MSADSTLVTDYEDLNALIHHYRKCQRRISNRLVYDPKTVLKSVLVLLNPEFPQLLASLPRYRTPFRNSEPAIKLLTSYIKPDEKSDPVIQAVVNEVPALASLAFIEAEVPTSREVLSNTFPTYMTSTSGKRRQGTTTAKRY